MEIDTGNNGLAFLALLVVAVLLEAIWLLWRGRGYPWKEALASFAVALLKRVVDVFTAGIAAGIMFTAYEYRLWTMEIGSVAGGIAFFLLFELVYYWHHRLAHEIRWLWATHSVHHSPNHMNLSVAGRLGWTGLISGSVFFFVPLALIGYHPVLVFLTLAASLFYQVWIHTEAVGRLGPLEWVLNTPSHHRVHHACNLQYIDRNYGGVLIVFDRLFGTFAEEKEKPTYGLVKPHTHLNPVRIAFHEWMEMAKDVAGARSVAVVFRFLFGRPGWRPLPDGQQAFEMNRDKDR